MSEHRTILGALVIWALLMLGCVAVAGVIIGMSWLITGGALLWWLP